MSTEDKIILDIGKAIDAAGGFAQGLETQDLEDKLTRGSVLKDTEEEEEENDDDTDES